MEDSSMVGPSTPLVDHNEEGRLSSTGDDETMMEEEDVALGGGAARMFDAAPDHHAREHGPGAVVGNSSSKGQSSCGKRPVPDSPVSEKEGGEKRGRVETKASGECQTLASFKGDEKVDLVGVEMMMLKGVPCLSDVGGLLVAARAGRFVRRGDGDGGCEEEAEGVEVQTDPIDTSHLAAKEDARSAPLLRKFDPRCVCWNLQISQSSSFAVVC
jgi:hypothetical protein